MAGLDPATHAGDARSVELSSALLGCVRVTGGVRGLFGGNGVGGRVKPGHDVLVVDPGAVDERSRDVRQRYVMAGLDPATHAGDRLEAMGMERAWVYLMTNRPNGTLYVGVTTDLVCRAGQHRKAIVPGFTTTYGLTRLVWFEEHGAVTTAIQRERTMKHWRRSWKVQLILGCNPGWVDLYPTLLG